MKWQSHLLIGASFGAVINPLAIPAALLGSTAPDWLEYVARFFGHRVRHRTVTHYVMAWLLGVLFFAFVWDWRHIGLGFAVGGFSHVVADSFTVAGVPFSWWSSERFHLFGGKIRTGSSSEYVVAGTIAVLCLCWVWYAPMRLGATAGNESGFVPFFYDWKGDYEEGLIDGKEWKDNRLKFL